MGLRLLFGSPRAASVKAEASSGGTPSGDACPLHRRNFQKLFLYTFPENFTIPSTSYLLKWTNKLHPPYPAIHDFPLNTSIMIFLTRI
jgi:hypothetical protein